MIHPRHIQLNITNYRILQAHIKIVVNCSKSTSGMKEKKGKKKRGQPCGRMVIIRPFLVVYGCCKFKIGGFSLDFLAPFSTFGQGLFIGDLCSSQRCKTIHISFHIESTHRFTFIFYIICFVSSSFWRIALVFRC